MSESFFSNTIRAEEATSIIIKYISVSTKLMANGQCLHSREIGLGHQIRKRHPNESPPLSVTSVTLCGRWHGAGVTFIVTVAVSAVKLSHANPNVRSQIAGAKAHLADVASKAVHMVIQLQGLNYHGCAVAW